MKSDRLLVLVVLICSFIALPLNAQQSFMDEPGIPAFTTSFPVEHGFINLSNGNLHLEIPIASYAQRGNPKALHARLVYDSRFWTIKTNPTSLAPEWKPAIPNIGVGVGGGFRLITDGEPGIADSDRGVATQCACISISEGLCQPRFRITYSNYFYQEPNGTFHRLPTTFKRINKDASCVGAASTPDGTAYATDESGYKMVVTNYTHMTVFAPDGSQVFPALQDTNGNSYSSSPGQTTVYTNVVDTLGRIPVITTGSGTQVFLDYLCTQGCNPANGDRARITINTTAPNWVTQFNQTIGGNVNEYSGPGSGIQSIVLPDNTSYQFQQDSYGQITSMTLPTGGQITFGYTNFDYQGLINRWVTSMTRDGQTWSFTPGIPGCSTQPCTMQVTVTTPPYNDGTTTTSDNRVYLFTVDTGFLLAGAWNTQIQYFRGSPSGAPLFTKNTDWGMGGACPAVPTTGGLLPIRETITWPAGSGTLSKKAEYCYDNFANTTATKEWDYKPNGSFAATPDREIDNVYKTDPNYVGANLIRLLSTSTTLNGAGIQVAQTGFGYDEAGLQPSGISTQHVTPAGPRGNLTSTAEWLNTTNSLITRTKNWYDTGELYKAIDAKTNPTTLFYDSTGAYPNKICNAKNQCSYFGYDFNTGLEISATDANGTGPGDPLHTTTDTYDSMLRPLCTAAPDGGQTCVNYVNPNTIQKTIKITSTLSDISSGLLDGLGRVSQTLHTTSEGIAKIDTTFDPVGAVATVSNPYFTTADPTYGITQSFHDALGRGAKTIKQDGSVSSTAYSVRSSGATNGICITGTDEASKKRTACHNGFGEVVEVDEPGAAYSGVQASGNIDIGPIKTAQVGGSTAIAASVQLIIQGTDRFKTTIIRCPVHAPPDCEPTVVTFYDNGKVFITVNGHEYDYFYGQNGTAPDNTSSVAQGLALAINADGARIVNASASSATITLTAVTAGTAGNSISYSTGGTWNTANWPTGPPFTASPASGSLSGGQNASSQTTVTDHGTVTMTAGPFTTPGIPYGPGTVNLTAASVATALANALSVGGSGVTASTNGGTVITVTEIAYGVSGNSVSISTHPVSADPTDFPSASFNVGSPNLSGGVDPDPSGLTLPLVTLYSYDTLGNPYCVEQHGDAPTGTGCPATPPGPTDSPVQPDPNNPWRRRLFAYDSLSRMRWASNPESGIVSYQYDNNGNVITKTDARGISINYNPADSPIDSLDRVTKKTFSNGDAPVTFTYDVAPSNAPATLLNLVGRLAGSSVGNVSTVQSYDVMGRIASQWQCTPLNCGTGWFRQDFGYNLAGGRTSHVFDNSFTITQSYDSAGQISQVTSTVSDTQHPATLASVDPTVGFYPSGAFRKITFGNGLTETSAYNNRLQPCRTNLNSSGSALGQCLDAVPVGSVQDFKYGFNTGAADNGNLSSFSAAGTQTFNRTYSYDKLNRLSSMSAPGDACSGLGWQYDAWANRNTQSVTGGTCGSFQASATSQNQLIGPYQYDAAGNMTNDGTHAYTYDSENRTTKVDGGNTGVYLYDAAGRRVQKVTSTGQTNYFLDLDGNTVVEKDQNGVWLTDYIYVNGSLLAQYKNATTFFFTRDHLGSTRLMTAMGGAVFDSLDYLPFGEQIAGGTGTTRKFTGKERDTESGLDYFGARFDSSVLGRFMSPDTGALHFDNPQSLNRYPYALNNPLRYVDPDGKASVDANLFWKVTHLADYRSQLIAQWGADARAGKAVPENAKWGVEGIANMNKTIQSNREFVPNPYEAEAYGNSLLDAANKNSVKEILDAFTAYLSDPHTGLNDLTLLDYALDGYLGRNDLGDPINFLLPEKFVLTWWFANHLNSVTDEQNDLIFRIQEMVKQAEERLRKAEEKQKEEEERIRKIERQKKKKTKFGAEEY